MRLVVRVFVILALVLTLVISSALAVSADVTSYAWASYWPPNVEGGHVSYSGDGEHDYFRVDGAIYATWDGEIYYFQTANYAEDYNQDYLSCYTYCTFDPEAIQYVAITYSYAQDGNEDPYTDNAYGYLY